MQVVILDLKRTTKVRTQIMAHIVNGITMVKSKRTEIWMVTKKAKQKVGSMMVD